MKVRQSFGGTVALVMNYSYCRKVLDCASPLALWRSRVVESARGLAQSKTLPCFASGFLL
jgi:hypothetical protein